MEAIEMLAMPVPIGSARTTVQVAGKAGTTTTATHMAPKAAHVTAKPTTSAEAPHMAAEPAAAAPADKRDRAIRIGANNALEDRRVCYGLS